MSPNNIVQRQQNQQRTRFTTREDVTCYKCGGKGHVATVCATRESNPGYQRPIPVKSLAVKKSTKAKIKEAKAPPAAAKPPESLGDEENYSRFDTDTTTAPPHRGSFCKRNKVPNVSNGRDHGPIGNQSGASAKVLTSTCGRPNHSRSPMVWNWKNYARHEHKQDTVPESHGTIFQMTPRQLAERRLAARKKAVLKKKTGISQQHKSRASIFLTTT